MKKFMQNRVYLLDYSSVEFINLHAVHAACAFVGTNFLIRFVHVPLVQYLFQQF